LRGVVTVLFKPINADFCEAKMELEFDIVPYGRIFLATFSDEMSSRLGRRFIALTKLLRRI
jgi:hypothetical protein